MTIGALPPGIEADTDCGARQKGNGPCHLHGGIREVRPWDVEGHADCMACTCTRQTDGLTSSSGGGGSSGSSNGEVYLRARFCMMNARHSCCDDSANCEADLGRNCLNRDAVKDDSAVVGPIVCDACGCSKFRKSLSSKVDDYDSASGADALNGSKPTSEEVLQPMPGVANEKSKAIDENSIETKDLMLGEGNHGQSLDTKEDEQLVGKGKGGAKGKGKGASPGKSAPPPKAGSPAAVANAKAKAAPKVQPRKPEVKPEATLRRLFWSSFRIDEDSAQNTIWDAIDKEGARINVDKLTTLFAADARRAEYSDIVEDTPRDTATPRARKRLQVYDAERRRQISVMLARLPGTRDTCSAVLEMNMQILTQEQVHLLVLNEPSHEEIAMLQNAEIAHIVDELNVWDAAEEFMLPFIKIPHFQLRLQVWNFENTFKELFHPLAAAEAAMTDACNIMLTSRSVMHLLGLVLFAGNYLNGGTPRGRADGFAIDTLTQIRNVKMSQRGESGSLVDYIAEQMEEAYPSELPALLAPGGDMERIKKAVGPKFSEIQEELRGLRGQVSRMLPRVHALGTEDPVIARHGEILAMCAAEMEELHVRLIKLEDLYETLCVWYHVGDGEKKKSLDEFCMAFQEFLEDLGQAFKALQQRELARRRQNQLTRRSGIRTRSAPVRRQPSQTSL